jgi:hypothetical protein
VLIGGTAAASTGGTTATGGRVDCIIKAAMTANNTNGFLFDAALQRVGIVLACSSAATSGGTTSNLTNSTNAGAGYQLLADVQVL